jgi:ectoine hydroxylase-related dioxygenase (phytanoyl-CoA dioxygenase family)
MLKWYGVRETTAPHTETERHAEEVRLTGFTVVRQLVDEEFLHLARKRLDQVYAKQAEEFGGEDRLRLIGEANTARCVLAHDDFFIKPALHSRILTLMTALLGDYFVLQQQNGVINPPTGDNHQSSWHRDLPYQHFVSSRPLAISVLWCLDEFNKETGGTWMLPASHKTERAPSEDYVAAHAVPVVANAGDVLAFDSMLFHRAGNNKSGRLRRGLNHVYALPFLKQQISFPKTLQGRLAEDPVLSRLLGYDSEPADSPLDWRRKRLAKAS